MNRNQARRLAAFNAKKAAEKILQNRIGNMLSGNVRIEKAVNPLTLEELALYREQMEGRAVAIERKNHKLWYKQPGERGITCSGRQKSRGKSIPAYFD